MNSLVKEMYKGEDQQELYSLDTVQSNNLIFNRQIVSNS